MSQIQSPKYVFVEPDFDSSVPKFMGSSDGPKNLKFATKIIPIRLDNTKHGVVTIDIYYEGDVDHGCISFSQPNSIDISSSDDLSKLFQPNQTLTTITWVFSDNGVKKGQRYYVIVNLDQSKVSDILLVNIGVGQTINQESNIASVWIGYNCPSEIYKYTVGLHVYSPYDSIYTPKLRTNLYSFIPISQWTLNTLVYCSPFLNNPALPYYYGYADKVYKVGGPIDRAFGTTTNYRVTSRRIVTWGGVFNKTEQTILTDGPKSFYDPIKDESPACVTPKLRDVGKIKEIYFKTNLAKPSRYRYYLGYDDNIRDDSSKNVFTVFNFGKLAHYPIIGSLHALIKMGSAIVNGYDPTLTNWRLIMGNAGLSGIFTWKNGNNYVATVALIGALLIAFEDSQVVNFIATQIFDKGVGWVTRIITGQALSIDLGAKLLFGLGLGPLLAILAGAIAVYLILKAFFKKTVTPLIEDCKMFLHRYVPTPYMEINQSLLKNEYSKVPNGFYSEGIYYYQVSNGLISSKTLCSGVFYDYIDESFENSNYIQQTGIQPDNPILITDFLRLIILIYTSGKPEPTCLGQIYYSALMEKAVPNKCCELEIPTQTKISIPAKQEFSCVSQLDADNKATLLLNASYEYATTVGNYSVSIPDVNIGILESIYTNFSWNEEGTSTFPAKSESTTLYFNNTDSLGLTIGKTVYFDVSGCKKVLKGYYTGAPTGGFDEETPSKLINQPIKTYQIESGKIKSISNEVKTKSPYPSYISNWFLFDINSPIPLDILRKDMDNSRVFNPLTLENNPKCYQGLIKKTSTTNYSGVTDFLILSGGTYVPAPDGYYQPLIDWIRHDPFLYKKQVDIMLNISENCDTLTERGFYISGVNKLTNSAIPTYNSVKLEVVVKNTNNFIKTFTATTSPSLFKTLIPFGTIFNGTTINEMYISKIITQSPLNNYTYSIGNSSVCLTAPPTIISFKYRLEPDNFTPAIENRYGFVFNDSKDSISFSPYGEFSSDTYGIRTAGLQIKSATGGVPITLIIYKNNVRFHSVTSSTVANDWSPIRFLLSGVNMDPNDIYTFGVEPSKVITYSARIVMSIQHSYTNTSGQYLTNQNYSFHIVQQIPVPLISDVRYAYSIDTTNSGGSAKYASFIFQSYNNVSGSSLLDNDSRFAALWSNSSTAVVGATLYIGQTGPTVFNGNSLWYQQYGAGTNPLVFKIGSNGIILDIQTSFYENPNVLPTAPTSFTGTKVGTGTGRYFNFSWNASTDNDMIHHYIISYTEPGEFKTYVYHLVPARGTVPTLFGNTYTVQINTWGYHFGAPMSWSVKSIDISGNESASSNTYNDLSGGIW
jgi:hypothetical protein